MNRLRERPNQPRFTAPKTPLLNEVIIAMLTVQAPTVKTFYRPVFLVKIYELDGMDWDEIEINGCNNAQEAYNNVLRYLPKGYRIVSVSKI
jgi:hypothetical protein